MSEFIDREEWEAAQQDVVIRLRSEVESLKAQLAERQALVEQALAERDEARALKVPAPTEEALQANMARAVAEKERDSLKAQLAAAQEQVATLRAEIREVAQYLRAQLAERQALVEQAMAGRESALAERNWANARFEDAEAQLAEARQFGIDNVNAANREAARLQALAIERGEQLRVAREALERIAGRFDFQQCMDGQGMEWCVYEAKGTLAALSSLKEKP